MSKLYIGNLPMRSRESDVRDVFDKHGNITRCDIKRGFAFIEFEDESSGKAAIDKLDGSEMDGRILQVEVARGGRHRHDTEGGRGGLRRGEFRAVVEGLGRGTSWQDLKDWARKAGNVLFTDVWTSRGERMGAVEFESESDLKRALEELNDIKLDGYRLSIREDRGSSRSPSPRRRRRRSRSRSRSSHRRSGGGGGRYDRRRSYSRSRSPSPRSHRRH